MATLTTHLNATRRLLRDGSGDYWSDADLTAHINAALKQRDLDSKQNRVVQTVPLTIDQNVYTINTQLFNARTVDVTGIVIIWGNARTRLAERLYAEASSIYQPTTTYASVPVVFAKMTPTQLYIAPKPNQAYDAEWDTAVISPDLESGTDVDPLPFPWTEPVPYYAAHLARLQLQQYDEAQQYKQLYSDSLSEIVGSVRGLYVPYPYPMARSRA
jgi:hypothetical protein